MFLAANAVLDRLVAVPEQAAQIGLMAPAVRQMEAVAQILLRKVDTESKYLARLEGEALIWPAQPILVRIASWHLGYKPQTVANKLRYALLAILCETCMCNDDIPGVGQSAV